MTIVQLEIPDKLAEKLKPYRGRLIELLELGLQKWQEREQQRSQTEKEKIVQILAASGKVSLPQPYTGEKPYVRRTPVTITGKPASEIIIEQRGPYNMLAQNQASPVTFVTADGDLLQAAKNENLLIENPNSQV